MRSSVLTLALALFLGLPGCGAESPTPVTKQTGASTPKSDTSSSTPPPAAPPTGKDTADDRCAKETTNKACSQCCGDEDPTALQNYALKYFGCQCGDSACADLCGDTVCGGVQTPSAACATCLNDHDAACTTEADTACKGDVECKRLFACTERNQCDSKP